MRTCFEWNLNIMFTQIYSAHRWWDLNDHFNVNLQKKFWYKKTRAETYTHARTRRQKHKKRKHGRWGWLVGIISFSSRTQKETVKVIPFHLPKRFLFSLSFFFLACRHIELNKSISSLLWHLSDLKMTWDTETVTFKQLITNKHILFFFVWFMAIIHTFTSPSHTTATERIISRTQ